MTVDQHVNVGSLVYLSPGSYAYNVYLNKRPGRYEGFAIVICRSNEEYETHMVYLITSSSQIVSADITSRHIIVHNI